jgi:hypothetical protein
MVMLAGLGLTLGPISAALILTFKQGGSTSAKIHVNRDVDFNRIPNAKWYLPSILLWPLISSLVLILLNLCGEPIPDPVFTLVAALVGLFSLSFWHYLMKSAGWDMFSVQ